MSLQTVSPTIESNSNRDQQDAKRNKWVWMTPFVILYTSFCVFCAAFAIHIAESYLFKDNEKWDLLPGLGEPVLPALGMYVHFWGGSILLLLGLVQILPISRRNITIHRIIGRVYIIAAIITSIGGFTFIIVHGCVGGLNMDIAFGTYGIVLFVCACFTFKYARAGDRQLHRNWAIRLWGQGVASVLYRLWYKVLEHIFLYDITEYEDFHRPIDQLLDWWFFVPNLIISECVVWYLNRRDKNLAMTTENSCTEAFLEPTTNFADESMMKP